MKESTQNTSQKGIFKHLKPNSRVFISIIWGYHNQLFTLSKIENYHLSTLSYAKEAGYHCKVFMINPKTDILQDPNFDQSIEVIYYKNPLQMTWLLFKHQTAVVYANSICWQNFFITPFFAKNTVFMAHDSIKRRTKLKQYIQNIVFKFYSKIRVIAPGEQSFLINEKVSSEKISLVPLAIDTNLFTPSSNRKKDLVFLGNITPDNDFETILHALAILKQKHQTIHLHIIGDVRVSEFIEWKKKYNVDENITLHGTKTHEEISELLPQFSIAVSTVISSGQHLSVFECALSGLGLVLPDTMQFNTVFNDMALFHPLYNPQKLAENICTYISNSSLLEDHNTKARSFIIANYSEAIIRPKIEKLLEL